MLVPMVLLVLVCLIVVRSAMDVREGREALAATLPQGPTAAMPRTFSGWD